MAKLAILDRFARVDVGALTKIKHELERLPLHEGGHHRVADAAHELVGTVTEVLSYVADEIERDYEQTKIDSASDGYEFEYVLTRDGYMECEVAVLTRLFSLTKRKGSIFYEVAAIRRLDRDRYVMTVQEE